MACREVEMGKNKCERYWPQVRQSMDVGAITVTTVSTEHSLVWYNVHQDSMSVPGIDPSLECHQLVLMIFFHCTLHLLELIFENLVSLK